ncbi:MAG: His-Xaa-Ser system radical SAM maturase HxsB [Elusimicrobia bacterium]|nr:His-Xaa-Ser system radical SAM maturase HxsB [Elusimicrobiota bacterium]
MAQKNPAKRTSPAGPPQLLWRREGADCLVTNDFGHYAWLKCKDFNLLAAGSLGEKHPKYAELADKGFVRDRLDFEGLAAKWRSKNAYLGTGPGLHILVLTLRCNHKCLYCQSAAAGVGARNADMSVETARKSVDFALQSSNPAITIEFQGGEPLLNWEALKAAVLRARAGAKKAGKQVSLALVSNFSLMTEEKASFLVENEVSVCTSLDGPADLHNRNRLFSGGNSHAATIKWLKYFQERYKHQVPGYRTFKPSALLTVSRYSLGRHKEIIDEYVKHGLEDIFIRPLAPIGYAKKCWGQIGYGAAEFTKFYLASLDYIHKLNRNGTVIREKMAAMMLEKIVNSRDPGYVDARCPCGAAIGQIAYNYNGDLYTCDEGRMVGWEGDDTFRIGNVRADSYRKVMASAATRACVLSSNLESQPDCARCVYKPYCGVCPVYNYEVQGSLWGDMAANDRCGLFKGIFGALFALLKKPGGEAILKKWAGK